MRSIDIIHTHSQFSAGAVLVGRLLFGWDVRVVHTIHNPWILYEDFEHRYGTMVERWSLAHVDHVTVPTKNMQQIVVDRFGVSPSDVSRVHMGIDLDDVNVYVKQHPSDRSKGDIVLCTARISRRKNQLAVLRAAPEVFAAFPEVQFVFCGPIDDRAYFRELNEFVQRCCLERNVVFTGDISKEKLYELYLGAKVFVFTSLVEVQSVALLEAIAFGLPVVASRIPANEEVLSAVGGRSVLVNPDEPVAIARAIIGQLEDGDKHAESGPSGSDEPMSSFSWRSSAREMEGIYKRLQVRR
jgi:glycosyltransferase involved in cell wall biosynthesis